MALAEWLLASEFNRPGHAVIDHRTFAFVGDGCLMEGISHEVCSLAGTLGLEKLIVLYDDNGISIDGHVADWFSDDTPARFEAYGWRVIRGVDGHDPAALQGAIETATEATGKPTLVCCRTVIGWGSPNKAGGHDVHGTVLGAAEAAATRAALGWTDAPFVIPQRIYDAWDARDAGAARNGEWRDRLSAYADAYPALAAELKRRMAGDLPADFAAQADEWIAGAAGAAGSAIATRKSSQKAIEGLAKLLPEFLGGSADLTGSNNTNWKAIRDVGPGKPGNYIHYGVREFAMAAIMNGVALHGGFLPFGGTFLVFSDYARNALRLSALMGLRVVYVLTHDSIAVGEDGPTHQPVEHVASLRLIPNMDVWRPADTLETAIAWRSAVERATGPTSLILTRQNLPEFNADSARAGQIARGGYVLSDPEWGAPDVVIIATGSEVGLAMKAAELLRYENVGARVVSMPSTSVFDRQDLEYRRSVLPDGVRRVAVEAGVTDLWWKYVGLDGAVVGLDRFGESAPAEALFSHFGFTAERVAAAARPS
jgi:transketolase